MAASSGLLTNFAVHPKLLFKIQGARPITFGSRHKIISFPQNLETKVIMNHSFRGGGDTRYVQSVGSSHLVFTQDDDVSKESYWSTKLKEFLRSIEVHRVAKFSEHAEDCYSNTSYCSIAYCCTDFG